MVIYEPFKNLPLRDFYEELAFEFPNLPTQIFDYYLTDTAIMMAKTGNLIRRLAVIESQPGVTRYRLESPDGMDICGVLDIRFSSHCDCNAQEVKRTFTAPANATCCCREHAWYDDREGVIHLAVNCCHGRYYITLSVTPSRGACELPEQFLSDFLPTLMMGTKASIMLVSGRPWTNIQLGQSYRNEFLKTIGKDAIDVATHKMRGGVKMQFGRVL